MRGELLLCYAPRARLALDPRLWPQGSGDIPLGGRAALPWGLCRALLGWAGRQLGDGVVAAALAPQRRALAPVLGGEGPRPLRCPRLPSLALLERRVDLGFTRAWVQVLRALLPQLPGRLLVPDLSRVDPESVEALRVAWQDLAVRPALAVGLDRDDAPADLHGRRAHTLACAEALRLEGLPGAVVERRSAEGAGDPPPGHGQRVPAPPLHPLDDGLELEAARAVRGPWSAEAQALALRALRACAATGGDAAVLGLGLELLAWGRDLSPAERAEVNTGVALAADRRALGASDPERVGFIDHHLSAALDAQPEPALRALLLLRLGVGCSRRRGRHVEALALFDEGLAAAESPELSLTLCSVLRAWLVWGRAQALIGLGRRGEVQTEVEAAWGALDGLDPEEGLDAGELEATRGLLAELLSSQSGWTPAATPRTGWQQELAARDAEQPPPLRARALQRLCTLSGAPERLEEAIAHAAEGLHAAEQALDGGAEERWATALARLRYRRGEAAQALALFERALALQERRAEPEALFVGGVEAATAACRAGAPARAQRHLRAARTLPVARAPAVLARLTALEARCLAHAGDPGWAETLREATALAIQSRRPEALLHTTLCAGELALGQTRAGEAPQDEARELLRRAEAMLDGVAAGPVERVAVAAPLAELGLLGPAQALALLALLPSALYESESWWALPRLLPTLLRLPAAQEHAAWPTVLAAAAARPDCAAVLR